jgi:hypothetical protein
MIQCKGLSSLLCDLCVALTKDLIIVVAFVWASCHLWMLAERPLKEWPHLYSLVRPWSIAWQRVGYEEPWLQYAVLAADMFSLS